MSIPNTTPSPPPSAPQPKDFSTQGSQSKDVPQFYYLKDQIKHPRVLIGDYTYGNATIRWLLGTDRVIFGKFTSLAENIEILMSGNHRTDWVSTYPFAALKSTWPKAEGKLPVSKGDVVIGSDVWIGRGVTIMSGVTIGDGAVIGACSVVAKDIPPYTIAVGNPARPIRKRFDDETIRRLLELKWWDWPIEKIQRNADILSSSNIEKIFTCE
ncbi:MAG: vat [Rickettsiales bacterium]|jgi:virginiamycin A acetyltransferase|nr:vat [Rickettsiales bacterium]